jgi:hypothetical protein
MFFWASVNINATANIKAPGRVCFTPDFHCQYLNGKLGSKLANLGLWLLLVLSAVVVKELLPWRQ